MFRKVLQKGLDHKCCLNNLVLQELVRLVRVLVHDLHYKHFDMFQELYNKFHFHMFHKRLQNQTNKYFLNNHRQLG
jgi:hypothetical protein